jgi:hypothetical protein
MKKIFIMLAMISCIFVNQSNAQSNKKKSIRAIGLLAGTSFVVAGLLQQPDEVWVPDTKSQLVNSFGQSGYFRKQKIWDSPTRLLTIGTGAFLIGFTFKF